MRPMGRGEKFFDAGDIDATATGVLKNSFSKLRNYRKFRLFLNIQINLHFLSMLFFVI